MAAVIDRARAGFWVDFRNPGRPAEWYRALAHGQPQWGPVVGVIVDCMTPGWDTDYQVALDNGLEVMLFQGYDPAAWSGGESAARARAALAVQEAQKVGFGGTLWLDSEAWPNTVTLAEWANWINTWSQAIRDAGLTDGVYVGAGQPYIVSPLILYQNLSTEHYWRSASAVPNVATRGYQVVQVRLDIMLAGWPVDLDVVHPDYLGGLPMASVARPAADPAAPSGSDTGRLAADIAALQQQLATLTQQVTKIQAWARQGAGV